MKKIIGILLLTAMTALGDTTYGTKDNPGLVDDPGCKTLIRNQLRDNKQDPKDYTITFYDSKKSEGAAMNAYVITDKITGRKVFAIIGLSFGPMPVASPSPPPSPSPTPAGLITTHV